MSQIEAILNDLGKPADIARELGIAPTVISEWKRQNSIPVRRWPALMALAARAGVPLDEKRLLAANVPDPFITQDGTRLPRAGVRAPARAGEKAA